MNDKRALCLAAALVFSACGKGDTCVPGATSACACPGGDTGAQTCFDDGTYGACTCLGGTGGSGGGSASSGGGSASSGGGSASMGGGSSGSGGGTVLGAHKRVFVTSTKFNGNMGGLQGVDANCDTAAQAANLGGSWVAWASDSTHNAIDRVSDVGPWYLLDGTTKAFNNKANLSTTALASIHINEQGTNVASAPPAVWTGTSQSGHYGGACNDWTISVSYESGVMGYAGGTSNWTNYDTNAECVTLGALYCIEQ